jgi:hypothetical protein
MTGATLGEGALTHPPLQGLGLAWKHEAEEKPAFRDVGSAAG